MIKFTKGQMIWVINSWNGYAMVYYRRGVVHSAGKKRMYIQFADEMAKREFYFDTKGALVGTGTIIIPIEEEPQAVAHAHALDIQAKGIAIREQDIATSKPRDVQFYRDELAKYQEVRIARYEDLLNELHEKLAAERAAKGVK